MVKTNKVFMAFAKGAESTEGAVVKKYIGVAPVFVLAVNPNKAELEKLYGRDLDNDPEYLGVVKDTDTKQVRLDFIIKTDETKCGVEVLSKVVFFVQNEYFYNKDKSKVQVIDKYGRTAWVTIEQAKAQEIPMYSNGPANLDKDYRPAYRGEAELTDFIKNYLNIPNVMDYKKGSWVMKSNTEDSEARLEGIANYFKGDFSELKDILSLQPNNKVKVMFGVRSNDGKEYQAVYTQMTLKNAVTDYSRLDKDLQERLSSGAYATTEFSVCNLKEYGVEATNFGEQGTDDLPFKAPDAGSASPWFGK